MSLCVLQIFGQQDSVVFEIKEFSKPAKYDFFIDEVIDCRKTKENIGQIRTGKENRWIPAYLPSSLEQDITSVLGNYLPASEKKTDLTLAVHTFLISEEVTNTEYGRCRIEGEFLKKENDKLYSIGVFQANIVKGGYDVTKTHGKRMMQALESLLKKFNDSDWQATEGYEIDRENIPYFFNPNIPPTDGNYQTLCELARGNSLEMPAYDLKQKKPNSSRYILTGISLAKIPWIVRDGGIYLQTKSGYSSSEYRKCKQMGRLLYFEMPLTDPEMVRAFGIVGAAASTKTQPLIYDTQTGKYSIFSEYLIFQYTKDYPELLKNYRGSKRGISDVEQLVKELNQKYREAS